MEEDTMNNDGADMSASDDAAPATDAPMSGDSSPDTSEESADAPAEGDSAEESTE